MHDPHLANEFVALRRFTRADASTLQRLAGDAAIAEMTLTIPHPYPDGAAEEWIDRQEAAFREGTDANFAIIAPPGGPFVGCIGVKLSPASSRGEIGYWIGRPYWDRGFCTAALQLLVAYCFNELGLERVQASHFIRNPASGRVLAKAGLQREETTGEHILKAGRKEPIVRYRLLRREFFWPNDCAAPS